MAILAVQVLLDGHPGRPVDSSAPLGQTGEGGRLEANPPRGLLCSG